MSDDKKMDEIESDKVRTAVALSTGELVSRFGSANAEFVKGYTGVDNTTGQVFAKSLKKIAKGKLHPDFAEQNLKQQAGYSAEVAVTSRDNAKAIIDKSNIRAIRSDDLSQYGRNHNVVDRVWTLDGQVIDGSESQMKFVDKRNELFKKIAREGQQGKNDLSRYRGVNLELPSEQFEGAVKFCNDRAKRLLRLADLLDEKGKSDVAEKYRNEAANYSQLAENLRDSGLTTKQAIFYREHPALATAWDIACASHEAGVEGAKYGAAIGSSISFLTNVFAIAQGSKELDEAAKDVAIDTAKAAAVGYGTAASGAALKGVMQQSSCASVRTLANTAVPTLALNICISLSSSVNRYVRGEITEYQFLEEVGEKGAGMLSSSMMAALGQLAIPIPVVGVVIGGMIGYSLSSFFYQSALDASRELDISRQQLERVTAIETAARARIAEEQAALDEFISRELPALKEETRAMFATINAVEVGGVDAMARAINSYAELLGQRLQFSTRQEFDDFMASDDTLVL